MASSSWTMEEGCLHASARPEAPEEVAPILQGPRQSRSLRLPLHSVRSWRKVAVWTGRGLSVAVVGTFAYICATQSSRQDSSANAGENSLGLMAQDDCKAYFANGQDCSKKNAWECAGDDDGSVGYRCCCYHGWGEFNWDNNWTTGMIKWDAHPEYCVDLSTPYETDSWTSGTVIMQPCAYGNPNKQFHMPKVGSGQIRWATHNEYCVGVQDGDVSNVNSLHLRKCRITAPDRTEFSVDPETKRISWKAHPDKCLEAKRENGNNFVSLKSCNEYSEGQNFTIVDPIALPGKWEVPKLFCVSLMLPFGAEVDLIRAQFQRQIGIFECAEAAVLSNVTMHFSHKGRNLTTEVMPGSLAVTFGGNWHTALNTEIFIRFWGQIANDARVKHNDWIVKMDPDCVFFPRRLQQILRSMYWDGKPKKSVFLNNCHLGMHGPIEVISKEGLIEYKERQQECRTGIYQRKWTGYLQEDVYFGICWHEYLKMESKDVFNLLMEKGKACGERSNTRDGRHPCFSKQVSFHPFKTPKSYYECYRRGKTMTWAAPMTPVQEAPGGQNQFHA